MQTAIIEGFPDTNLGVSIIWSGILAGDDTAAARKASLILDDPRVKHYYDPHRRIGQALADQVRIPAIREIQERLKVERKELEQIFQPSYVGGAAAVFDTCLFYAADSTWGTKPPVPAEWVTQLDPTMWVGIDPKRFHWADDLVSELRRITTQLTAR